jgi:hypothetical protein
MDSTVFWISARDICDDGGSGQPGAARLAILAADVYATHCMNLLLTQAGLADRCLQYLLEIEACESLEVRFFATFWRKLKFAQKRSPHLVLYLLFLN